MKKYYRNSDFVNDTYFKRHEFREMIQTARKAGKDVLYNTIRLLNNCKYSRILKGYVSLQDIFKKYWDGFVAKNRDLLQRKGLMSSVERFIKCKDFDYGYFFYDCPNCDNFHMIGFTCKSRFCPSCGNKYRDQRTEKVSEKLIDVPHRQFVFAIPVELRIHFRKHREMLSLLFQSVNETFNLILKSSAPIAYKKENRKPGIITFIHTFGRDMKWHPHIHALVAERFSDKNGNLHKFAYFHFDYIRTSFRNILVNKLKAYYKSKYPEEAKEMVTLLNKLEKKNPKGFYVYGPQLEKESTLKDTKALTNYIARYASHPPISEKRIISIDYQTNRIKWFYDPHEDDDVEDEEKKIGRQIIEEDIEEFIKKLIIHIPTKNFNQIRYYGFYSNKCKVKISNNNLFPIEELNKMKENTLWINDLKKSYGYSPILCYCGCEMILNEELSFYPGERRNE